MLAGFAATLSACGEERMTPEEVLAQARTLEDPQAGLYAVTTELLEFEVTGAPPAVADRLRTQMGDVRKSEGQRCITPEEAEKGFKPLLEQFAENQDGLDCGFTRFEASAPRFNAKLTCDGPLDAEASVAFAGETSSEGYELTMDTEASSRLIAGGAMEMRMRFTSERVGECEADATSSVEADTAE